MSVPHARVWATRLEICNDFYGLRVCVSMRKARVSVGERVQMRESPSKCVRLGRSFFALLRLIIDLFNNNKT